MNPGPFNINIQNLNLFIGGGGFLEGLLQKKGELATITFNWPAAAGDLHWVKPDTMDTGSICAKVSFNAFKSGAMAKVTQSIDTPDLLNCAYASSADTTNQNWEWTGAQMIGNAKYSLVGAENYLHVWSIEFYSTFLIPVYRGSIRFLGVKGTNDPCGGIGKPPSSSGMSAPLPGELQSGIPLSATITDGKNRGVHVLTPAGQGKWKAMIGNALFEFSLGSCGKKLLVESNKQQSQSIEFNSLPFFATFDGKIFQSSHPVLLVLK